MITVKKISVYITVAKFCMTKNGAVESVDG
jgi:hypothetical protein